MYCINYSYNEPFFYFPQRSSSSKIANEGTRSEKLENKEKVNLDRNGIDKLLYENKISNSNSAKCIHKSSKENDNLTDDMIDSMLHNNTIIKDGLSININNSVKNNDLIDKADNYDINDIMNNDDIVNEKINNNMNSINNNINNNNNINDMNINNMNSNNNANPNLFEQEEQINIDNKNDSRKEMNRKDSNGSITSSTSIISSFSFNSNNNSNNNSHNNSNNNNAGLNHISANLIIQKNKKLREKTVREMITEMEVRAKNNLEAPQYVTKLDKLDQDLYSWQKIKGINSNSSDELGEQKCSY